MEVDFPEHLKCPVCFEIPETEIYQCKNGHIICHTCVESLSSCPQCRDLYGASKMRNKAAESLLDLMKFDCSFKNKGCTEKVSRKEISTHLEDCVFGGESFALCKSIGYDCDYVIKTRRLEDALTHLKENHSIIITTETNLQINLKKITEGDRKSKTLWNPVIISTDNKHFIILTFSNTNLISFFCLCFGDVEIHRFQLEYSILGKSKEIPALEWSMTPIPASKSETILRANPFRFPLELFEGQYMSNDELAVKLSLTNPTISGFSTNSTWKSISPSKALNIPLEKKLQSGSSGYLTMSRGKAMTRTKLSRAPIPLVTKKESSVWESRPMPLDTIKPVVQDVAHCATCDVCSSKIYVSHRYKCLQCCDYDLCPNCMTRSQHSHIFAVLKNYEQNEAIKNKLGGNGNEVPYLELEHQRPNGMDHDFLSMLPKIVVNVQKTATCVSCNKATEVICLVCRGAQSFCGTCFQGILNVHNKSHYFAVVKNNKAREAIIKMLCQNNLV